jgi:hypothetical protein
MGESTGALRRTVIGVARFDQRLHMTEIVASDAFELRTEVLDERDCPGELIFFLIRIFPPNPRIIVSVWSERC